MAIGLSQVITASSETFMPLQQKDAYLLVYSNHFDSMTYTNYATNYSERLRHCE